MPAKEEYFHQLAKDERGLNFPLPGDAKYWRVQRMPPGRGKPATVYAEDGPLQIVITAETLDELKNALRETPRGLEGGRYKLVPVDAQGVQVGSKCGYTPPFDAEGIGTPDDEPEESAPSSGSNAVIIKLADRIIERDNKLIERYAALAEKAFDVLGQSQSNLIKGYAQVRPVVEMPVYDEEDSIVDDKDFFERVAGAGPAMMQLLNAWNAFQASRRDNMTAAAAGAAAGVGVDAESNGTNGAANGHTVGIKRPAGSDGSQG